MTNYQGLLDIMPMITMLCGTLFILVGAISLLKKLIRPYYDGTSWFSIVALLSFGGFITIAGPIFIGNMNPNQGQPKSQQTASPTATPSAPSAPIDWSPHLPAIVIGGIVILALIAALVLIRTVLPMIAQRRAHMIQLKRERELVLEQWRALLERRDAVDQQFLQFDRDLDLLLTYPIMRDYRQPETVALVEAMQLCRPLATDLPPSTINNVKAVESSELANAVRTYERAFAAAMAVARQVHAARLTPAENEALRLSRQLLKLAQDGGAQPAERRAAYERVIKTLGTFLDVKQVTIDAAIEAGVPTLAIAGI